MHLTVEGQTLSVEEWAEEYGIPASLIRSRLRRGWSEDRAVTEPMVVRQGEKLAPDAMLDLEPPPRPIVSIPAVVPPPAIIPQVATPSPRPRPCGGRRSTRRVGKAPTFVTYNGERRSVSEWARQFGISPQAMHARLQADPQRAFRNDKFREGQQLTFKGQTLTISQWASRRDLAPATLHARLRRGWTIERALESEARKINRIIHCHGQARTMKEWACALGLTVAGIQARIQLGWTLEHALSVGKRGGG